ncbi:helix-turn-helix domain-containing protein [Nonomuraea sp. NPDC023979]|uniref:helix-turn-helix domain-containing protein n=1 Tax=Nonomuraea sp. NPDC023979 TaxID=3154796 RepID=UPI0033F64131
MEGLASARAPGRVGGRPPALDARGIGMARTLYDTKGADGRRRYTVAQIAGRLGVSRATIYRHLDPDKPDSRRRSTVRAESQLAFAPTACWRTTPPKRMSPGLLPLAHGLPGPVVRPFWRQHACLSEGGRASRGDA